MARCEKAALGEGAAFVVRFGILRCERSEPRRMTGKTAAVALRGLRGAQAPQGDGTPPQAAFFSISAAHFPRAASEFILARCAKARWPAATFSALPDHAFCGAA